MSIFTPYPSIIPYHAPLVLFFPLFPIHSLGGGLSSLVGWGWSLPLVCCGGRGDTFKKEKSQKKERTLYYNTTLFGQAPLVNLVFKFFYTFYYIFSISFSYRHNLTIFYKSSFPARRVSGKTSYSDNLKSSHCTPVFCSCQPLLKTL